MYQMEKALTQRAVRQAKELEVDRKLKRLIPRELYEQSLAAAAVVTSTGLEAFVYDSVREIIHLCGGTLEKEDALREYMLERVKDCLLYTSGRTGRSREGSEFQSAARGVFLLLPVRHYRTLPVVPPVALVAHAGRRAAA